MEYDIKTNTIGDKFYYKKGTDILHREDGPAVEYESGEKYWMINNQYHRTYGPAIEWDIKKEWWINGHLHRENGPAVEWENYKEWWINGQTHRADGPAVEWADGDKEWWINGERLSPEKETILNQWWENKNGI